MKTLKNTAIAALLSCSLLTPVTPAMAVEQVPPTLNSPLTPQEVCDAQLRPDLRSEFRTQPIEISNTGWVNVGGPRLGDAAGDKSGFGTPVASNVFLTSGFFRNGGSPNVWGGATATLTYPQTQQLFNLLQDQSMTTTYDCHVHKDVGGGQNGDANHIEPPGLQSSGNTTVQLQTISAGTRNEITEDDFVVAGQTITTLICISPNNMTKGKPGTWTAKHGFPVSQCDAASLAAQDWVPSANAPIY